MSGLRMSLTDYNAHQARVKAPAGGAPRVPTPAAEAQSPTNTPLRDSASISLDLPWPPSVNQRYRSNHVLPEAARAFRERVISLCQTKGVQPITGRLEVRVVLHAPDRRFYDVDNRCKGVLDALQHGGVYANDRAIDRLIIERGEPRIGGVCRVMVSELCL